MIDFLGDIAAEMVFEFIGYGWLALMRLIVPKRYYNSRVESVVKILVGMITLLLLIGIVVGLALMAVGDGNNTGLRGVGFHIFIVALGVSVAQIVAGVIVRIVAKIKGK